MNRRLARHVLVAMSTKICQEHLVKNFASWAEARYGEEAQRDMIEDGMTANIRAEFKRIVQNAYKPSGWKRLAKFEVGSKVDVEGGSYERTGGNLLEEFPNLKGWTCRIFLLKESDSIEIALFEKDGVISDEYVDYSD